VGCGSPVAQIDAATSVTPPQFDVTTKVATMAALKAQGFQFSSFYPIASAVTLAAASSATSCRSFQPACHFYRRAVLALVTGPHGTTATRDLERGRVDLGRVNRVHISKRQAVAREHIERLSQRDRARQRKRRSHCMNR
jgi:hypothetical protein